MTRDAEALARARERHGPNTWVDRLRHGPNTWVDRAYGCQCGACTDRGRVGHPTVRPDGQPLTAAERGARSRANLEGKPVPDTVAHGGLWALRAYRCTCEICMAARKARAQAGYLQRIARLNAKARGHWGRDDERELDIIHWIPADAELPWLCPHCDQKFWERRAR
jgi:hypothetical protein